MATTVPAVVEAVDSVNVVATPLPTKESAVITVNSLEAGVHESLS